MFSSLSARFAARRRGRLIAACTSGVLAAGAFALGPAGVAHADAAAPHQATITVPQSSRQPTFTPPTHKRAFSTAAAGAATTTPRYDYDGDGVGDLLWQYGDGSVGVLSSATKNAVDTGLSKIRYRDILTPGDLTAGSAGDEVLGLTYSGHLSMFSTVGLADSRERALWSGAGWQIYNKVVAVGDINGDGWGDLLARTPTGDLYLYKGTGNAGSPFAARVKVGYGYGIYDQLVGAGDITAAGHQTLVARDLTGDLWMYTLDGAAPNLLAARVKIGTGWNVYNQLIGYGDDRGAVGGILGRTVGGDLYFYQGTGSATGTLTARVPAGIEWNDYLIAGQGHAVVWGRNNLFAQTSGGNLYEYFGGNEARISPRDPIGKTGEWKGAKLFSPTSLTDADERPLLQVVNGSLYNTATAGYVGSGWGSYTILLGPGDLNGDGRADVLARDTGGVLWLLTGKGDGTFSNRAKVGAGWGAYNQIAGDGDINGDGIADIVARASNGHLYLYQGTGISSAPFKTRIDIGGGWNTYTKLAAPGDLDGDGRADIVGVTSTGQLYLYCGSGRTGTTTFTSRLEIGTAGWNSYSAIF